MKKIFAALLAAVMLLSLVACGKDAPTPSDSQSDQPSGSQTVTDGVGGTQAQAFENKIALSIDKTKYDKENALRSRWISMMWIRITRSS